MGEELGRAVSLLLDDRAITKIAGTGEEKGKEKQAPGQDRAGQGTWQDKRLHDHGNTWSS